MSKMLEDPHAYFRRLAPTSDALLQELETEAATDHIPIIGPVVGRLLYVLARTMSVRSALELGAAIGYSTIHLARACAEGDGFLTTIEADEDRAARARDNLRRAGLQQRTEVVVDDALTRLERLRGPYDLIFMDIDKAGYVPALPHCHRLLRPGGLLVTDNVAFTESDPFNQAVLEADDWRPVSLFGFLPGHSPENDGVCLALRV